MTRAKAAFTLDYAGVGRLLRGASMQHAVRHVAGSIKERAVATAPVGDPRHDPHPGLYRASFTVDVRPDGGSRHDRAQATITNTAWYAAQVEYGTGSHPARHTLLRAAEAARAGYPGRL